MYFHWIKRFSPRSLFVRALLIMLLPLILLQLVVGFVFIQRHYESVTNQMAGAVGRDLNYAISAVERAPSLPEARAVLDFISGPLGLPLTLEPDMQVTGEGSRAGFDLSGRAVIATLKRAIAASMDVDLLSDRRMVTLRIATRHGTLVAQVPRSRVSASNPHQLLVLMVFASLLLTVIATLFLRNQVRPIRELALAADEFGKGRTISYRPRGAEEVRRAGTAFLAMRGRLERQIEQRTQMLSGVSHDLRTPLTRLKLSLSMLEDEAEKAALLADVRDMERMLDEFLEFARSDVQDDPVVIDPLELAEAVVFAANRDGGCPVALVCEGGIAAGRGVAMRASAVGRALQNLIGNAQRYGSQVRLSVKLLARSVEFIVEDDGPGIAADQRDSALRPFVQLDPARNKNKGGGVGLGLAVALDVARSHGGALLLGVSAELGGLKATLRLPR